MKHALTIVMLAACALGARVETITIDLERPLQPLALAVTEYTDATVIASLRASGADYDPAGWTGLFWYGDGGGGVTLTNSAAARGVMSWNLPAASMPTNGRYSVQILGVGHGRTEEWGRGVLSVRLNPSASALPAQWVTNGVWWGLIQAEAATRAAADSDRPTHAAAANIAAAAVAAAAPALTVADARRLVAADSNSWATVEGGTNWLYSVSNDISRVYIKAASAGSDGPPVGTTLSFKEFSEPASYYVGVWGEEWDLLAHVGSGFTLLSANNIATLEIREWSGPDGLPALLTGFGASATYILDYIPVTNRVQISTVPGTLILLTEHDGDPSAHPTLPRSNDVVNIVGAATNHLIRTYLLSSNAWFSISNETLRVHVATGGAPASVVWESAESAGGDTVDPQATNLLWQALASGLASKADTAWGKYAPDGSANPDSAYMTFLNAPALMHAAGFQWASSGAYSVLSSTGAVAYIAGEGGEARWGLDLSSNYVGFVRGGSVTVGAIASSFATQWPGTPTGTVSIAYGYESGDFPSLWYTPALSLPFDAVEGVWVDNTNGTATVTAAATAASGFWQATTSRDIDSTFVAKPPARFDGGVFGATNALPVVYDSTIQINAGGKTYRIPAQEVP